MGREKSSSSSINSSNHPCLSSASSLPQTNRDLSVDLRLGLSISVSQNTHSSTSREQVQDWPPIKQLLRSTLTEKGCNRYKKQPIFFVKVYMEGNPIGRKINLHAHHDYNGLVTALSRMFKTTILCNFCAVERVNSDEDYVLTYEDEDEDWMMVGDVPWDMFLTAVKRLKITRGNNC